MLCNSVSKNLFQNLIGILYVATYPTFFFSFFGVVLTCITGKQESAATLLLLQPYGLAWLVTSNFYCGGNSKYIPVVFSFLLFKSSFAYGINSGPDLLLYNFLVLIA